MKSHLIDDLDKFGIWNNDYDLFLQNRADQISAEIKKRVIEQDIDKSLQLKLKDYNKFIEKAESIL